MTQYFFKQKINKDKGAVVIVAVLLFIIISSTIIFAISNPIAEQIRGSGDFVRTSQGYLNTKVASEDAVYRLNKGYTLPADLIDLGSTKQIFQTIISQSPNIPFLYGAQVGIGGLVLSGDASISGNIFLGSSTSTRSLPISGRQIDGWKAEAGSGVLRGTSWMISGATIASTTGATKIDGNLSISDSGKLIVNGILHVTGDVSLSNSGKIELGSDLGTNAGVVVVDGKTNFSGNSTISGNGNSGSFVVLVSTNTSCSNGGICTDYAISASSSSGSEIFVAQNGGIYLSGGTSTLAVIANHVYLNSGVSVQYISDIAHLVFSTSLGSWWGIFSSK